jgi:thiol-disulfide isomerase/thioredoxin
MPAGTLPSLRGPSVSLRAPAGKPSVVVIFADWCDPCHADMPSINASAKRHPAVRFLGIDELESAAHARTFVAATHVPFETLLLTNEAFSKPDVTDEQRGATGLDIPAVYVLDGRGVVVQAFVGGDPQVGTKIDATLRRLAP